MMKDIFDQTVTTELIDRINKLTPDTQPRWGKMTSAQMLAHCNMKWFMTLVNIQSQMLL
jgi:hypothetical protein